jgi:hypothetical protein
MSSEPIPTSASAGKLHLLDLADIKAQMGGRWARMADPVERFFEGAVRRNLGPGDTFLRQGELSYILLFRDLAAEEAQVKCRTIAEEVCERLFGDQIQCASLRTVVVALGPDALAGDAISGALDEMLERKGKELIVEVASSKMKEPAAVPSAPGAPAEESDENEFTFLYRPIWDATKNVVITYLCQSIDASDASANAKGKVYTRSEDKQAVIDRAVLQECAERTHQLHRSGLRILSGVAVDLDTLSHSRLWAPYSKELQRISPDIFRDFAFFVTGIDSGVPNIRLTQELPKLTRLSRQIFCVIEDRGYVGARFSRTGTHAIGIDLLRGDAEAFSMLRIRELAKEGLDAGLATFVLGVQSTSIMLYAIGQGIRYLEGAVIRPAVPAPRHAFAQSLEYVYTVGKNKVSLDKGKTD